VYGAVAAVFPRAAVRKESRMALSDPRTEVSAERVARNEATFREANEAIEDAAEQAELTDVFPVICECADPGCTEILRVSAPEYEEVRAEPRWFINAIGHVANAEGWGEVVATRERYEIVAKQGEAGELVERLDPRKDGPA
jgi:hypothetical protein